MNSSLFISNWGRRLAKQLTKPRVIPKPKVENHRWNIVRGDQVQVVQGPQIGQKGKVLHVLRDSCRVIVESVNLVCFVLYGQIYCNYFYYE